MDSKVDTNSIISILTIKCALGVHEWATVNITEEGGLHISTFKIVAKCGKCGAIEISRSDSLQGAQQLIDKKYPALKGSKDD